MNGEVASAAMLAMTSGISSFTALLPELSDVRKSVGNMDMTNDVRMGEVAAITLTLGIGLSASVMTKSPVPGMVAVVSAVALVILYESVLNTTPKELATT